MLNKLPLSYLDQEMQSKIGVITANYALVGLAGLYEVKLVVGKVWSFLFLLFLEGLFQ